MSAPESFYAIRRTDGELIQGDYGWVTADGQNDWTAAEEEAEYGNEGTEYEMVRMTVERIAVRTLPTCRDCDDPAAHWGLCEKHAREDDPSAFDALSSLTDGAA